LRYDDTTKKLQKNRNVYKLLEQYHFMGYTYRDVDYTAAFAIAEPVLKFLAEQNSDPSKSYKAKGRDCGQVVKIVEIGRGIRKIFPRKIATIHSDCHGYFAPNMKSLDENVLPQAKLEGLLSKTDFARITMGAVFASQGADEYRYG